VLHLVGQSWNGSGCTFFRACAIRKQCNRPHPALVLLVEARDSLVSTSEDEADVAKVLAGDFSAFEGIVRRWQGPLVNLAYRFCGDRGRAEDMSQEAFLQAYKAIGQWRKDAAFSTWLFALATNMYRSELRRIPVRSLPLDDVAELRDSGAFDGGLEENDLNSAVRHAVFTLPPKYREVLILFYFHDMNVTAAAQSLDIPEGTVKARLSRGREILRGKLLRLMAAPSLKEA
jgi:RNA polymerase sigma-70 factor, ECF subfamily